LVIHAGLQSSPNLESAKSRFGNPSRFTQTSSRSNVTVRVASEAGCATAALVATPGVKARSALISLYRFMAVRPSRPERKDMSLIRRDKKFAVRDRRLHPQTHCIAVVAEIDIARRRSPNDRVAR
jgi:hypothetical protein